MHWEMGNDDWMTKSLFLNNDAPLLTADENDIGFDTDKGLAALTLYQRFHKGGGQKPITSNQPGRLFLPARWSLCRHNGSNSVVRQRDWQEICLENRSPAAFIAKRKNFKWRYGRNDCEEGSGQKKRGVGLPAVRDERQIADLCGVEHRLYAVEHRRVAGRHFRQLLSRQSGLPHQCHANSTSTALAGQEKTPFALAARSEMK